MSTVFSTVNANFSICEFVLYVIQYTAILPFCVCRHLYLDAVGIQNFQGPLIQLIVEYGCMTDCVHVFVICQVLPANGRVGVDPFLLSGGTLCTQHFIDSYVDVIGSCNHPLHPSH